MISKILPFRPIPKFIANTAVKNILFTWSLFSLGRLIGTIPAYMAWLRAIITHFLTIVLSDPCRALSIRAIPVDVSKFTTSVTLDGSYLTIPCKVIESTASKANNFVHSTGATATSTSSSTSASKATYMSGMDWCRSKMLASYLRAITGNVTRTSASKTTVIVDTQVGTISLQVTNATARIALFGIICPRLRTR